MAIEKEFLADIVANPDDDAPRLVFADWLDENGDPDRAEFIRAQCELARPRLAGGTTRRRILARRVKILLTEHAARWAKGYGHWSNDWPESWARGFPVIARLEASLVQTARQLPAIVTSAPVRELEIVVRRIRQGEGRLLTGCAALARLTKLELFGEGCTSAAPAESVEVETLLRSPHLQNLEQLNLIQVGVGRAGFQAVLGLPRLSRLYLYTVSLDNSAARELCRSPLAGRLTELRLGGDFTAVGAKTVAETPALAGLRFLDFDNSTLRNAGAGHLAGAAHLASLRELRLHRCGIGDAGAAALASSPYLKQLRVLVLSRNALTNAAVASLIRSKTLPRSLDLDLWDNDIDEYEPQLRHALRGRFRRVNFDRSH